MYCQLIWQQIYRDKTTVNFIDFFSEFHFQAKYTFRIYPLTVHHRRANWIELHAIITQSRLGQDGMKLRKIDLWNLRRRKRAINSRERVGL